MALGLIACAVAASAAVGTLAGAGFTVGTANALHPAPFFLSDVENCEADNQRSNHNDNDVIGARNALFGSEGRHGVGTGKVNGDQFFFACISLLNGSLFLVDGNTSPVADLLITTGQRIIHGSLATVGIARKSNSHGWIPP